MRAVVAPLIAFDKLFVYLDGDVAGAGARAAELSVASREIDDVATRELVVVRAQQEPQPRRLPADFALVQRETVAGFNVLRLRSPRPRSLGFGRVSPEQLAGAPASVLIQGSGACRRTGGLCGSDVR